MNQDEFLKYDATGLAELIRNRDVSQLEVVDAAIARAEKVNPKINAIVTPMYEEARAAAKKGATGPLAGVPFLIKDLNFVKDVPCSMGSRLWANFMPDHDGEIVTRYRKAGLVFMGKSNTPEVGLAPTTESVALGPCRNPYDVTRTPGGSSGGAAAAVAAGILPAAHATDGGGSIRIPASCCGLVGLKPTRARTPMGPDVGEGWGGMSIGHVVSRTVRDSAFLLDLTHGPAKGDPYCAPAYAGSYVKSLASEPRGLKVLIDLDPVSGKPVHEECRAALRDAATLLEKLGHHVEAGALDYDRHAFTQATDAIVIANVANTITTRAEKMGVALGPDVVEHHTLRLTKLGRTISADQYAKAMNHIHAVGRQIEHVFDSVDLILSPTLLQPPALLGYMNTNSEDGETYVEHFRSFWGFTSLYNATGEPAITLPLHFTKEGLPVGVQLAAPFGNEEQLLQVAAQIERAIGGFNRRPNI